jgi:branched-chain amino acid transport system ATP-binding protein
MGAALAVENLEVVYHHTIQVLRGLSLAVPEGGIVALLGANGAGKTTTLRAVSGMIGVKGEVHFDGQSIANKKAEDIVRRGVAHVPQGRGTIADLTVEENLLAGAFIRRDHAEVRADIDKWFTMFPRLAERHEQAAGSMSGGEQQMLAIARALMSRPRLLLLDEPSLGLAPLVTRELFERLGEINRETSTTMLIVEQNANLALEIAARGYVLEAGAIVASGSSAELSADEDVRKAYLGY